jgi:hypothetical protein
MFPDREADAQVHFRLVSGRRSHLRERAVWIGRSMKLASASFYESDAVNDTAETVARALDNGGVSALDDIESRIDPKNKLRFFVFDPDLNEVSGGPAPESVRALASNLRPQERTVRRRTSCRQRHQRT